MLSPFLFSCLPRKRCPQHSPFLQLGLTVSRLCGTLVLAWSPKPPSSSPNLVYSQAVPRCLSGEPMLRGCFVLPQEGWQRWARPSWSLGAGRGLPPASVPMSPVTPRPRYEISVHCLEGFFVSSTLPDTFHRVSVAGLDSRGYRTGRVSRASHLMTKARPPFRFRQFSLDLRGKIPRIAIMAATPLVRSQVGMP